LIRKIESSSYEGREPGGDYQTRGVREKALFYVFLEMTETRKVVACPSGWIPQEPYSYNSFTFCT
jgi:hypothetical protein